MSRARLAPVQELPRDECLAQPLPPNPTDLDLLQEALVPLIGLVATEDVREIAVSGEWVELEGGRRLFSQGDAADALYLLVHGRLRASVSADDGSERVLGDLARGEAVGEMALLGRGVRNAHIDAVRDSRLFRLKVEAFHQIASRHPEFLVNLSRLVLRRMEGSHGVARSPSAVRTIAIACTGAPEMRERFVTRLAAALEPYGTTAILRSADLPPMIERDGDPGRMARRARDTAPLPARCHRPRRGEPAAAPVPTGRPHPDRVPGRRRPGAQPDRSLVHGGPQPAGAGATRPGALAP